MGQRVAGPFIIPVLVALKPVDTPSAYNLSKPVEISEFKKWLQATQSKFHLNIQYSRIQIFPCRDIDVLTAQKL